MDGYVLTLSASPPPAAAALTSLNCQSVRYAGQGLHLDGFAVDVPAGTAGDDDIVARV